MQTGRGGLVGFNVVRDNVAGNRILIEQAPCSVESMGGNEQAEGQDEEKGGWCLRALSW